MTADRLRDATILLLAADHVINDDMDLEEALGFAKWFADYDQDTIWSNGKHSGDCTKESHPCARCHFEGHENIIKIVSESGDWIDFFFQNCLEAMTTPFDNPTLVERQLPR